MPTTPGAMLSTCGFSGAMRGGRRGCPKLGNLGAPRARRTARPPRSATNGDRTHPGPSRRPAARTGPGRTTTTRRPPAGWRNAYGTPFRRDGHHRQPRQAAGPGLPVERDLRRAARLLGLRSARRRAEEQRQAPVVEGHGAGPRGRRRPGLVRDPRPRGVGGQRPRAGVRRPAHRVPVVPQALPGRPPGGGLRGEARQGPGERPVRHQLPQLRRQGLVHRAAHVQRPAQDLPRPGRGRVRPGLPAARDRPGHLHQLPQRPAVGAAQDPVRHRPDRQVVPQRDHAGQLHLPHPRVRADGDGVLRPAPAPTRSGTSTGSTSACAGTSTSASARRTCGCTSTRRRSCRTTPSAPSTSSTGSTSSAASGASWRASPTAPTTT